MDHAVRLKGTTLFFPADVREALVQLHAHRSGSQTLPNRVWAVAERKEGRLLFWPGAPHDLEAYPLRVSPGGRQVTLCVPDLLAELNICLPPGIIVGVPLLWLQNPAHGKVLALPLREGIFLYRKSYGSAIGALEEP